MNESVVSALLNPVVTGLGLELDAVEVRRINRRALLRISLDGDGPSGGGPTLDQVAAATTAISAALDAAPEVTGEAPYVLEVGTRGVSRPLSKPAHYRRNVGHLVVCTRRDGAPALTGRIRHADDDAVTVECADGLVSVPYGDIAKAVVQAELRASGGTDVEEEDEPWTST